VHYSEVHQRANAAPAKDILGALAAQVDLVVLDITRAIGKRAPVEAYHAGLPMQHARQASPKPATNPSYDDRAVVVCASG
jgi:hypothetical protein